MILDTKVKYEDFMGISVGKKLGICTHSQGHEQAMLELTMTLIIAIQINLGG